MKLECVLDGQALSLTVNSDKPLSRILSDDIGSEYASVECKGGECGLCIVLVDGKAVKACMATAFAVRGKRIETFEAFRRTRAMKDIEKAYEATGAEPCPDCYATRTMLYEAIVRSGETRSDEICRALKAVSCPCMTRDASLAVAAKAIDSRRKRNVRRA